MCDVGPILSFKQSDKLAKSVELDKTVLKNWWSAEVTRLVIAQPFLLKFPEHSNHIELDRADLRWLGDVGGRLGGENWFAQICLLLMESTATGGMAFLCLRMSY